LVVRVGGSAQLVSAESGDKVDLTALGADLREARFDYAEHRSLSFDASGRFLAYLRRRDGSESRQIVVRELASGSERSFEAGPGEVFRLELSADARYVVFDALREDTNKNGKLDWPVPEEPAGHAACASSSLPRFRSYEYQGRGDALTRAVVTLDGGSVRDVPGLLMPLGAGLLVRQADGALAFDQGGKLSALSPASCGARVLFADAQRGLVLASCAPPPLKTPPKTKHREAPAPGSGKRNVWLFGVGFAKDLQRELYETTTDREAVTGARLVPVYTGSDAALLDLDKRELLPLAPGSRVLAQSGALALIWRDNELFGYDAEQRRESRLAQGVERNPDLLQTAGTVLLTPFLAIGPTGPVLTAPPHALAVSAGGLVLSGSAAVPAGAAPRSAIGPLRWVDPRSAPQVIVTSEARH
jgi:hypothetical protein